MALVVLLKGVNVGGHRTFRPSTLATTLRRLGVVNIGAAGTFVVRKPVSRTALRAALRRQLPFETHIVMCEGRDILRLVSDDPFASQPRGRAVVWFVSVLARRGPPLRSLPRQLPATGRWCVNVLAQQGRFVLGLYRREMRTIGYLGQLETVVGATMTTRNWNTILTIARILEA